jgi:hypothetical protein
MTKLDLNKLAATPPEAAKQQNVARQFAEFMAKAAKIALALAPGLTKLIDEQKPSADLLLAALHLFNARLARRYGVPEADFVGLARASYLEAPELFASPVADVLRTARALIAAGEWCQGNDIEKKVRDDTTGVVKNVSLGRDDSISDAVAFGVLAAIDESSDAESNRSQARELFFLAIRDSGFKYTLGASIPIIIKEWNDYGWAPPLPEETVMGPHATPTQIQRHAEERAEVLAQWPKAAAQPRTKDEVLLMFDTAVTLAGQR